MRSIYCLIFLLLLAACTPTSTEYHAYSPVSPPQNTGIDDIYLITDPPFPALGKASISGLLYSFTGKGPIPSTLYYLTPAREPGTLPNILVGPREENGDIRGISDEKGRIFLNNIPPGNYYLVVWAPYNWIFAVESEVDTSPRLITLEPNQRLNLGLVYLAWP